MVSPEPAPSFAPSSARVTLTSVGAVASQVPVAVGVVAADGDEQVACFAFAIEGLRFAEAGMLSWVVRIDGDEVARLPMRVQQAQQQG